MITITRALARQLQAVYRRAGLTKPIRGKLPPILFQASAEGLHIRALSERIAVEYHVARSCAAEEFALPMTFLRECEGAKPDALTLTPEPDGRIRASWFDRRALREVFYDDCQAEIRRPFPSLPETWGENDERFLPALQAAVETCDPGSLRYALNTVQLQGPSGEMAATDSRQLLLQSGFQFPWDGDLLLPGSNVFRSPELQDHDTVLIGRTEKHVTLRIGPWTVHLPLDETRRFPKVRDVIPSSDATTTRFRVAPADGEFLRGALSRLPGAADPSAPITVECNGHLAVRAQEEGQKETTELVLSRSEVHGEPVQLSMNRCYLERALQLGFQEVCFTHPEAPLLCQDERRKFVWQTLAGDGDEPLKSDANVVRIHSDAETSGAEPATAPNAAVNSPPLPNPQIERNTPVASHPTNGHSAPQPVSTPSTNGHLPATPVGSQEGANGLDQADPITEAEALKEVLRQALTGTSRLLAVLRRQKKQAQLVRSTLASLRQLQNVG